ncbi:MULTISPECIES: hypothetical protein [Vibrio]|uniref:Uncharacterized protein n=1 Tax=Vibrio cidicii TaxID=1763883 RepID=A0ABR5W7H1_9VIBR|nr:MULTISPECIES: hypothetical protein [Vibrio]KYN89487.1 hypothetical protein ATY35_11075 [Vibrio cidicii]MBO0210085.1 hypothetical protein [Vibrio sp. Vb0877]MCR9684340.1 hypothetical protein [Vibrio antiquarius]MDU9596090.1 hypothetical protein [Vibrio sp. 2-1-2a]MDU9605420.1 hypothetical protein [Vibrio sp. 1-2-3a]
MKVKWLLVGLLSAPSFAIPVENDAVISKDFENNPQLYEEVANLIRLYGYKCDSLSALRPMVFSRGFVAVCNRFSYTYEIEDKGGRWVVTLD